MAFSEQQKIEYLKGKVRDLFDPNNEEFDAITSIPALKSYVNEKTSAANLSASIRENLEAEIRNLTARIATIQTKIENLSELRDQLTK